MVQAEVEFLPMYVGQPLFSEVETFLRTRGFALHGFLPQVCRTVAPLVVSDDMYAGINQLVWADAVFVRDLTRLDRLAPDALLRMAAILHDCYGSVDVTLHLLAEHDRRAGGRLSEIYLSGLQRPALAA